MLFKMKKLWKIAMRENRLPADVFNVTRSKLNFKNISRLTFVFVFIFGEDDNKFKRYLKKNRNYSLNVPLDFIVTTSDKRIREPE